MTKKNLATASLIVVVTLMLTGCASIINPGKRGLMWRPLSSGLDEKKTYDDGIVWHWPWNNVIEYDVQWKSYTEHVDLLTADDLHITTTVTVLIRPKPRELPQLHLEIGRSWYRQVIRPEFMTTTRDAFAKYIHNEIPEKSSQIEKDIYSSMLKRIKGKHLEIGSVAINHVDYSKIVTKAVDKKLATKHRLQEKEYETGIAKKDAEIQRIRAEGQRDAQKIIDEGLTKKYLQFKSLEVQEKLATSPNAKFYFIPLGKDGIPVIIDTGEK